MKKRIKYKETWKNFSLNKAFWKEVLVGRKIKKLHWDEKGLVSIELDTGERVFVTASLPTFAINN